jgi:hypothetical protein
MTYCTFQCFLKRNCPDAVFTIPLFPVSSSKKRSGAELNTTSSGTKSTGEDSDPPVE